MKMNLGLWAALALVPCGWVTEGTAHAASPHWSSGLTSPSGEPLVWMPNCARELTSLGLKRCFSSTLVPRSFALNRLLHVRQEVSQRVVPLASSCGAQNGGGLPPAATPTSGLRAPDLQQAYGLTAAGLPTGAGDIVAIVDACSSSTIVADVAAYRTAYSLGDLPECGGANGVAPTKTGAQCIGVVSQTGKATLPAEDDGWAGEIALDVEMVSAACPQCSILLVEVEDASDADLGAGVAEAIRLGADAVTNSYGSPESGNDSTTDYTSSTVLIAAASGDNDYYDEIDFDQSEADAQAWSVTYAPQGANTPASMPGVLAVGGSMVYTAPSSRGFNDSVWSVEALNPDLPNLLDKYVYGGGSGCSQEFAKPSFQSTLSTGSCTMRASVDVSGPSDYTAPLLADGGYPSAGSIMEYSQGEWQQVVGTSAASPFVTGVLTRVGLASHGLAAIYAKSAAFNDVTSGNNDPTHGCTDVNCTAGVGWDGPTGFGTPWAPALAGIVASAPGNVDAGVEGTGDDAGGGSGGTSSGGTSSGGTSSGGTSSGGTSSGATSSGSIGSSSGSTFEDAGTSGTGGADGGGNFNSSGGSGSGGCAVSPADGESPFVPALSLLGLGAVIALRVRRRK
jgi:MYXO-CTERM domain-containing protein